MFTIVGNIDCARDCIYIYIYIVTPRLVQHVTVG